MIKGIDALHLVPEAGAAGGSGKAGVSFGEALAKALEKVNEAQLKADEAIKKFLAGEVEDLHAVMIALREAEIWMQLAVQVRNKVVEAYQEISRMPV
ncbi:MAG: flagellar hook-basal body complex protein FliE [Bacillota bacterium]